jgi:hypothetical protein
MPRIRLFRVMIGPPMPAFYIHNASIGPGLFLQHPFATIIDAKSIGKNCWIKARRADSGFIFWVSCGVLFLSRVSNLPTLSSPRLQVA